MAYPSITSVSYSAGLSQTGQFQVGLRSFICKNNDASKHCKCKHVDALWNRVNDNGNINIQQYNSIKRKQSFQLQKVTNYLSKEKTNNFLFYNKRLIPFHSFNRLMFRLGVIFLFSMRRYDESGGQCVFAYSTQIFNNQTTNEHPYIYYTLWHLTSKR